MAIFQRFIALFSFTILAIIMLMDRDAADENSCHAKGMIGTVTDDSSRVGKEQKVAIEMAFDDFCHLYSNQTFTLHARNSQGDPLMAADAARDLIDKHNVQAIIGPQTWEETSLVAEVCTGKSTPVLPLADSTPTWATKNWPFLLQTSLGQSMQMKAVAAIVQSWEWYQVSIIYEDRFSSSTAVLPHLLRSLREANTEISNLVAIPSSVSSSIISNELDKLREGQCRVFVVHLSFPLALQLFETAKEMNMMQEDYVWIATDPLTSLVHSLNASAIFSMQGIIGVRSYFPEIGDKYKEFYYRFRQKFSLENPQELNNEPGIFAAQAYDAAWAVALAMRETDNKGGRLLLDKLLLQNFSGLSGQFQFREQGLATPETFQIINVMGKSYGELGFWTDGLGFSKTIGPNANYSYSMKSLGQVVWPGGPWKSPRGWSLPTVAKPLRIGVPARFPGIPFVKIVQDDDGNTTSFDGFAINLFKEILELLPFHLPYQFFPFMGTYDELVEEIYLKNYDAVVGDVSIVSRRYKYAEFTQPYTDPGVVMVVPLQSKAGNRAWLFMKPFTKTMWFLIVVLTIYTGFVLWMIERNNRPEFTGSLLNQTGILVWFAFTTLISFQGDKLHSNLSRMTMVVWLFVALIITQTYTANLASMLTVERLEPTVDNVDQLRDSNAMVGYARGSFLKTYLQEVLHFHPSNIKQFAPQEEFAQAFRSKEIAAAFLELPFAKIFLRKYCKEFTLAGPMYKIGGLAFAFPKGSPLLLSVNKALLEVFETGKLREMENRMLASEECEETEANGETTSLSLNSFWALFTLTASTSTIALMVYIIRMTALNHGQEALWRLMMVKIQKWGAPRTKLSKRVSDVAGSMDTTETSDVPSQV